MVGLPDEVLCPICLLYKKKSVMQRTDRFPEVGPRVTVLQCFSSGCQFIEEHIQPYEQPRA